MKYNFYYMRINLGFDLETYVWYSLYDKHNKKMLYVRVKNRFVIIYLQIPLCLIIFLLQVVGLGLCLNVP